jgi:hypothetical protein
MGNGHLRFSDYLGIANSLGFSVAPLLATHVSTSGSIRIASQQRPPHSASKGMCRTYRPEEALSDRSLRSPQPSRGNSRLPNQSIERGQIRVSKSTPIDDPRLLASQRSARDQQVSPGNDKKQTPRPGEARGCHSARGRTVGKQINLDPLAREVRFFGLLDGAKQRIGRWETLIGPKRTQIGFRGPL